jgi:atypical dual specificity phosphatase
MFSKTKGCLFLNIEQTKVLPYLKNITESWQKNRQSRDGTVDFHITIVLPKEIKEENIDETFPENGDFIIVGLKQTQEVAFLVIHYPAGDKFRKNLGLPEMNFHITLGFASVDIHNIDKSVNYLEKNEFIDIHFYKQRTIPSKQLFNIQCLVKHFPNDIDIIMNLIEAHVTMKQYDEAINQSYILLSLDVNFGVVSILKLKNFMKTIDTASVEELWGYLEGQVINPKYQEYILKTMNKFNDRYYYCHQNNIYTKVRSPRNFSKITDNLFASAIFKSSCLDFMKIMGITSVINLMEKKEEPLDKDVVAYFGKKYHQCEIVDRSVTSHEHMNQILDIIEDEITQNNKVGKIIIHCMGGKGRTNMVVVCYLMRELEQQLDEILERLYKEREVIFSDEQMNFMREFQAKLLENPKKPQKNIVYNHKKCPKLIMLIGLPASGKSTLSNHLVDNVENVVRANQDEQGRKEVLATLSKYSGGNSLVLVDRCNLTVEERQEFSSYLRSGQRAWAIVLETPIEECIYRAQQRPDHPTLKPTSAERIITEISKKYEPVTDKEGFDEIIRIKSSEDLNFILETWKLPPIEIAVEYDMELMKFPRTRHLYNLGGASRDDLLLDSKTQNEFLTSKVVIEEKIDGANMGISIEPDTYKILFQNRSHYVTSAYATQFRKLDVWEQQHREELFQILEPGRHILFGEWLFMKHSINYTRLPGYFVAFDIYDKQVGKFYSRDKVTQMLSGTTIPLIHMISEEIPGKMENVLRYVRGNSHYYDGPVEGVYVRICDGDYTVKRAKIVRHDFLSGNQDLTSKVTHWTKQQITENTVLKE